MRLTSYINPQHLRMTSDNGTANVGDTEEGKVHDREEASAPVDDPPFGGEQPDSSREELCFCWKKYTLKKKTSEKLRLVSVLYDIGLTSYLLFWATLPDAVGNTLFYPYAMNILLLGATLYYWKEVVAQTEARTKEGAMRHNVISFVALLLADVTETTVALLFLGDCSFNFLFFVQILKFPVVFPHETYYFFEQYIKDQKEIAGTGDGITRKVLKCIIGLMVAAIVFAILVPVANFAEHMAEAGSHDTCEAFG